MSFKEHVPNLQFFVEVCLYPWKKYKKVKISDVVSTFWHLFFNNLPLCTFWMVQKYKTNAELSILLRQFVMCAFKSLSD